MLKKNSTQVGRQSVSAEAYGEWNKKKAFTPPNIPKSDAQRQRLSATLEKSFLFAACDQASKDTLVLAMDEVSSCSPVCDQRPRRTHCGSGDADEVLSTVLLYLKT